MAHEAPATKVKKQRTNKKRPASDMTSASSSSTSGQEGSAAPKPKPSVRSLPGKAHGDHLHLSPDIFPKLLGPLSPAAFLREHYHPKFPLLIKGHDFTSLLDEDMEGGDVLGLLEATPSENISVWTVTGPAKKINTARVQDAGSAAALYAAGHSLYCRAPEEVENVLVESAIAALGLGCRVTEPGVKGTIEGEVELFLSHAGHMTPFHFDFQENVTLQLKGRKRWRLRKGVRNPVRGCTPHYQQVEGVLDAAGEEQLKVHRLRDSSFAFTGPKGEEMVVVVEEGDVFYHPAGLWHAVECLEESVSINISLDGMTYADLFSGALKQVLWGEGDGRFTELIATGGVGGKEGWKEGGGKQKKQKGEEDGEEQPQERMRRLLLEASERLRVLAEMPEALLPPCVWWNSEVPPMKDAAAVGEDEEEEEEHEHDGCCGEEEEVEEGEEEEEEESDDDEEEEDMEEEEKQEEEEEEGEDDFHCKDFPISAPMHGILHRNPLASFFRLDDVVAVQEEGGEGLHGRDEDEEVEYVVHVNFGGSEDLSSVFRKKVWVPRGLGVRVASAWSQVGREADERETKETQEESERQANIEGRVLGAMLHLGVLLRMNEDGGRDGGKEGGKKK